eukprot:CAMPEP_0174698014 /NCGR_PEP_ID=MMETSP1094-20130205/3713_1 /TAXON_ID=156173 /ORGANISM="Chrysochromulina brevifilum, Strain UTEX LB 985" /LENGTH=65 /DNA_ID=CAMNT_0015895107 /DNA_START=1309 /DNA_END=1506 /DNA_ORIENTATION=-
MAMMSFLCTTLKLTPGSYLMSMNPPVSNKYGVMEMPMGLAACVRSFTMALTERIKTLEPHTSKAG